MKRIGLFLFALIFCCVGLYAADAATTVTANTESTSVFVTILHYASDAIMGGFLLLFGLGFNWLVKKSGENAARVAAIEALHAGVEHAWNELGAEIKAASADGKYTSEEKKKLRDLAIAKALEIAKGSAKDLLLSWGTEIISAKIRAIVDGRNTAAASTVTVASKVTEVK